MSDIFEWLKQHGLEQYAEAFDNNDIEIDLLTSLTEQDLRELGMTSIGHRRKFEKAVATLRSDEPSLVGLTNESAPPTVTAGYTAAERRQLTVMFVDLVGSTHLSRQLDPEDYGVVIERYRQSCVEQIDRYGGYVAQFLGDGIMVYFGYPVAHEHDVLRALHAGVGMLHSVAALDPVFGTKLQIRIGVATGTAVVGVIFGEGRDSQFSVLGDIPNLAARLQGVAEPGRMIASDRTHTLAGEKFEFLSHPPQSLKGIAEPVVIWEVISAKNTLGFDLKREVGQLAGVVGRDREIAILHSGWERACAGEMVVASLSGEAGIGKTALTRTLYESVQHQGYSTTSLYCSSLHENSAFYPLIRFLERAARFSLDDIAERKRTKLKRYLEISELPGEEIFLLLASLLSIASDQDRQSLNMTPVLQKEKTRDVLVSVLQAPAQHGAALVVVEDLHWSDPSTLEVMSGLVHDRDSSLMLLSTYRPEFTPRWSDEQSSIHIELQRLDDDSISSLVQDLSKGSNLPVAVIEQIIDRTDGIPLYVEELTRTVMDASLAVTDDTEANSETVPEVPISLQDSLMARLDRLAPFKEIAQLAAVIGRQFSLKVLAAVSSATEDTLRAALHQFDNTGLVFSTGTPPDNSFVFKHALVHEAAYNSTLKSQRQQWHLDIAGVLEDAGMGAGLNTTVLLAHHYQGAGQLDNAIRLWHQAGRQAIAQSANLEASAHLRRGLDIIQSQPDSAERQRVELGLLIDLGDALTATAGYAAASTGQVYERAHQLTRSYTDAEEIFPAIYGLWNYYLVGARTKQSFEYAERFHRLSREVGDSARLAVANCMLGQNLAMLGQFTAAHEHLAKVCDADFIEQEDSLAAIYGEDPRATSNSFDAWMLWHLGYPRRACERSQQAVDRALLLKHSNSTALALTFDAILHILLNQPERARSRADEVLELATQQRLPYWEAEATIIKGWTELFLGEPEQGLAQMNSGLEAWKATGATEHFVPGHTTFLAAGYLHINRPEQGIELVDKALEIVSRTAESWYEAELHRLRAELLLQKTGKPSDEALKSFEQAQTVAETQQSLTLQLRVACGQLRSAEQTAHHQTAIEKLKKLTAKLDDGFETDDLSTAHALLQRDS